MCVCPVPFAFILPALKYYIEYEFWAMCVYVISLGWCDVIICGKASVSKEHLNLSPVIDNKMLSRRESHFWKQIRKRKRKQFRPCWGCYELSGFMEIKYAVRFQSFIDLWIIIITGPQEKCYFHVLQFILRKL